MAEEIERDTLNDQNSTRGTCHGRNDLARLNRVAFRYPDGNRNGGIGETAGQCNEIESGYNLGLCATRLRATSDALQLLPQRVVAGQHSCKFANQLPGFRIRSVANRHSNARQKV